MVVSLSLGLFAGRPCPQGHRRVAAPARSAWRARVLRGV